MAVKCPKCQTENLENRKFCRECAAKLVLICPQCGCENLPGDKFCGGCAHGLAQVKTPAPVDYSKPQSYTPKFLAEKILSTGKSMEGERKIVTVLFADAADAPQWKAPISHRERRITEWLSTRLSAASMRQ